MVLEDDFEVHLVDAETLIPFKEHYRDGKHYIEVEPKAEYLLSYQRVRTDRKEDFLLYAIVDDKRLGWSHAYVGVPKIDRRAYTDGVWHDNEKSLVEVHPLIFVPLASPLKRRKEAKNLPTSTATLTIPAVKGKVEFRLFTVHQTRQQDAEELPKEYPSIYNPKETTIESTIDSGKNNTGSKNMNKAVQSQSSKKVVESPKHLHYNYYRGKSISTITLHYCTVPELIDIGILPKPTNDYDYYKIINRKQNNKISLQPTVIPQRKCITQSETIDGGEKVIKNIYYDFFDLTTLEDDDSDCEIFNSNVHSNSTNADETNNSVVQKQDKEDKCSSTIVDDASVDLETQHTNKKARIPSSP